MIQGKFTQTKKMVTIQQDNNVITIGKDEIPGYEIVEGLGCGGMGVVWKAIQKSLKRIIALKILSEKLASDAVFVKRFMKEAEALASVSHPNIVQIYDVGQIDDKIFYAMEYIDGKNLQTLIKEKRILSPSAALEIAFQVATALQEAHSKNIIHRDIKPPNILITTHEFVKLTDFGLAKNMQENLDITSANILMGSPKFMAPEQINDAQKVDARTDIYALGVTLYQMVTGKSPFLASTMVQLFESIAEGRFVPIQQRQPSLPPSILDLINKMMEKNPARRYQNCTELIDAIEAILFELGVSDHKTYRKLKGGTGPIAKILKVVDLSPKKMPKVLSKPIYLVHKMNCALLVDAQIPLPLQLSTVAKIENSKEKFWELILREGSMADKTMNSKILGKLVVFSETSIGLTELEICFDIDEKGHYTCVPKDISSKRELSFIFQSHASITTVDASE